jgi:CheY-like chemotaxis protein/HPt (histidine-containing phosphotransfer) domain-containing protein
VPPGLRALILEPDPSTAGIALDYLAAWGVDATHAVTTADACRRAADGPPFDLAILGADPDAAAAALRACPGGEAIELVLLEDVGAPVADGSELFARKITRPLKQSQLREALAGDRERDAGEAPAPSLPAGLRVLVAEDHEVNRELLVRQLAKLGVRCDAVGSGREAVEAVRAGNYDAVLMDFHMPEVDGPQAARAIRALPGALGATPVVAVTAGGTPAEREACAAAGMHEFLPKPISSRALARALARVLERAPGGEAGPGVAPAIDADAIDRLDADLGDRDELRRIAGIYLAGLAPGALAIAAAAEAGDADALARAAHRLASASATFGAARVAELCERLEGLGAEGRTAEAATLTPALADARERAAAELRSLLELP